MKKREVSPDELKKIIELRQDNSNWIEIEKETKVERRAAKRAYEEWENDKKLGEQKAVRFRVAAEAFHEHMNDMVRLADSLVSVLHVPGMLRGMDNAEGIFNKLWTSNIQVADEQSPTSNDEIERVARRNKMLFKSLQVHTQEKVRWKALEEWKQACDKTGQYSKELRLKAVEVIRNIITGQPGLKKRLEIAIGGNNVIEKIADGVRETIYREFSTGKPSQMNVIKGASIINEGNIWLEFYEDDLDTKLDLNDSKLAKEVLSICKQVVTNLQKKPESDLIIKLTDEVRRMQDRTKELEERLDGLLLRPIILRTQCDLCPA